MEALAVDTPAQGLPAWLGHNVPPFALHGNRVHLAIVLGTELCIQETKGHRRQQWVGTGPALILCQTHTLLLRGSRNQNISSRSCGVEDDCYRGTKENMEASRNCTIGLKLMVSQ